LHLGFNMEDDTLLSSEVPVKKAAEDAESNAEVITAILYLFNDCKSLVAKDAPVLCDSPCLLNIISVFAL
jgi:hypothetical protein